MRICLGTVQQVSYTVKKAREDYAVLTSGQEAHWEVVERILFIYAKLNPGQSYVQGMNEIIGPIYYLFATDVNSEWRRKFIIHLQRFRTKYAFFLLAFILYIRTR